MPLMIKIFIWRACYYWIPALANLGKRGIAVDRICPVCKHGDEFTVHVSWMCHKTKVILISEAKLKGEGDNRNDLPLKAPDNRYYKVNCSDVVGMGGSRIGIAVVVEHILNGRFLMANYGHILEEITFSKMHNPRMEFKAINKTANRAAQKLARIGVESTENKFLMEKVPAIIRDMVAANMPS
ncbi:hypothetical protein LWI29_028933 [Acer saccharum]|uniref:Reverse transcriptase zinc-binding domain-containing protein n=1 Tax=Acer saccharum TaxID=4024 RepID=A0AA39RFJ3_ACESA|nr:hypothetical protein LWI29_028933 [Acer saccharum]